MKVESSAVTNYDVAVLVAGSRSYQDRKEFSNILMQTIEESPVLNGKNLVFISGMASGPDKMIIEWAKKHDKDWIEMPAKWEDLEGVEPRLIRMNSQGKKYNAAAGHLRNEAMAELCTHGVIFYDGASRGTAGMIEILKRRVIPYNLIMVNKNDA